MLPSTRSWPSVRDFPASRSASRRMFAAVSSWCGDNPPVVLYPWRYATDKAIPRERAKLRPPVSDLRKTCSR